MPNWNSSRSRNLYSAVFAPTSPVLPNLSAPVAQPAGHTGFGLHSQPLFCKCLERFVGQFQVDGLLYAGNIFFRFGRTRLQPPNTRRAVARVCAHRRTATPESAAQSASLQVRRISLARRFRSHQPVLQAGVASVFSMENLVIVWSLPRSKGWKSSLRSVPTASPCAFRTTTGTVTRFTDVLKVAESSAGACARQIAPAAESESYPPHASRAFIDGPLEAAPLANVRTPQTTPACQSQTAAQPLLRSSGPSPSPRQS
jgi:hypothetical protein